MDHTSHHHRSRKMSASRMYSEVVMWRCTDRFLTAMLLAVASLATFLLLLSLGSNEWLYTHEPLYVNKTDPLGVPWEVVFEFTSGYWKACRDRFKGNETQLSDEQRQFFAVSPETKTICMPNVFFSGNDVLGQMSKATVAILSRIQLSSIFHAFGFVLCLVATVLGSMGYFQHNIKTLYSGISFICSGMFICIAVLQFICVVDDEMTPRMKPTPQGDPSKFRYKYGIGSKAGVILILCYAFFVASVSFILIQTCAVGFLTLFMRRFPGLEDKMHIVPGLQDKIRSAYIDRDSEPTSSKDDSQQINNNNNNKRNSLLLDDINHDYDTSPSLAQLHSRARRGSYGLPYTPSRWSQTQNVSGNVLKDVLKHEDRCPLSNPNQVYYDENKQIPEEKGELVFL